MQVQQKTGNGIAPIAAVLVLAVVAGFYGWRKSFDIPVTVLAVCGGLAIGIMVWAFARIAFVKKMA